MAIERQTPDPAQEAEQMQDMTTERSDNDIDNEIIEILEGLDEEGIQVQEDGSVILGEMEEEMSSVGFSENLAEVVSQNELSKIYVELVSAIENDKSARKDWEKTYTDGLKYLGMKLTMAGLNLLKVQVASSIRYSANQLLNFKRKLTKNYYLLKAQLKLKWLANIAQL